MDMMNRQRKRAFNIIRCHKNVRLLKLIQSEKMKETLTLWEQLNRADFIETNLMKASIYLPDGCAWQGNPFRIDPEIDVKVNNLQHCCLTSEKLISNDTVEPLSLSPMVSNQKFQIN